MAIGPRRFIRFAVAGAFTALVLGPGPLAGQRVPPVSAGRVAGQLAAGVLGTPIGFVGGGLATRWASRRFGASDDRAGSLGMAGGYVGAALLTAAGPALVGPGGGPRGSYWASLAGATVGGLGSFLLVHLNQAVNLGTIPRFLSGVLVFALPSVGATVGYNRNR